jgi:hypothetical protein
MNRTAGIPAVLPDEATRQDRPMLVLAWGQHRR